MTENILRATMLNIDGPNQRLGGRHSSWTCQPAEQEKKKKYIEPAPKSISH
jgi:hypothetical protein